MRALAQDLRYAMRLLLRAPGFTLLAAGVLALGIGALAAIFSVVDAALLRPLPFANPGELVMLWEKAPDGYPHVRVSPLNFQDWHDQNSVFSSIASVSGTFATLQTKDGPEQLTGQAVTSEFFTVLGIHPIAGRAFHADDERLQANVVVISEKLWRNRFGADPKVLGSSLNVNGKVATIIGIAPARFGILSKSDLWTLYTVKRSPEQRRMHYMQVLARLKPGLTLQQAQAGMEPVARQIGAIAPETNRGWTINIEPLRTALVGHDLRVTTLMLLAVVGFVLLMACANVANLMLARGAARGREMAVRAALGAASARLTRQLITESLALAILGGIGGIAIAALLIRVAPTVIPPGTLPTGLLFTLDLRVLAFAVAATLLTGIAFGLVPVWQLARTSVSNALQSGGNYSATSGNRKLLGTVAATQVAAGVMIVAAAMLLIRTLDRLNQVDPGFHADRVLTMHVSLPFNQYKTPERALVFYEAVQKELASLPGVESVSFGGSLPTEGWDIGQGFEIVGEPPPPNGEVASAHYQMVGADYFRTLGISLAAGRPFDEHDNGASPQVAIVNEEFVRHYLHGRNAVGTRVGVQAMDASGPKMVEREIVGVIRQVKVEGLGEKQSDAEIYVPLAQNPWFSASLAIRTAGEPFALLQPVKKVIAKYDPELAVSQVQTMNDLAQSTIAEPRFRARLLAAFAGLALTLSAFGVFGVLAFSVAQRRREFGIRMAVGAQIQDVFNLVLGGAARILGAGLLVGIVGAAALAKSLSALLYDVHPLDPLTFLTAPLVLTLVALAAAAIPATRAVRTNPAVVLRQE
jgi:putative ABC transport system permease protein